MAKQIQHKPVIETLINSAALALFSFGVIQAQKGELNGYIAMLFGTGLEFFKYWGRAKELW